MASPSAPSVPPALARFIARCDAVDAIDIRVVLAAAGATPNEDRSPDKWKLPSGSNLWIKKNTQGWKDLNTDIGGQGAMRLVAHLLGLSASEPRPALKWLETRFLKDGVIVAEALPTSGAAAVEDTTGHGFRPPPRMDLALDDVRHYLTHDRAIPPSLVESEIASGRVYATRRRADLEDNLSEWQAHCVFSSSGAAELRSVVKDGFKGTAGGSACDSSGYRVPAATRVSERLMGLVEASVDALSYRAIFPGRLAFSTNGAGRYLLQLRLTLECLDSGYGVRVALDADPAGDLGSQHLFNAIYVAQAVSRRLGIDPQEAEDWLMTRALEVTPTPSPHHLFFGLGRPWSQTAPCYEVAQDAVSTKEVWRPSGAEAPLQIPVRIARPVGPFKAGQSFDLPVTAHGYAFVTQKMNIRRDRPVGVKDWNEVLCMLGSAYVRDYEDAAANDFRRLPDLPPDLAAMRQSSTLAQPAPARSPSP